MAAALAAVTEVVLADMFALGLVGLVVGDWWVVFGSVSWGALRVGGWAEL